MEKCKKIKMINNTRIPIESDAKRMINAIESYIKSLKMLEAKYYPLDNSKIIKPRQDYIDEIKKYHGL